jgi:hypothetical protein
MIAAIERDRADPPMGDRIADRVKRISEHQGRVIQAAQNLKGRAIPLTLRPTGLKPPRPSESSGLVRDNRGRDRGRRAAGFMQLRECPRGNRGTPTLLPPNPLRVTVALRQL